MSAAVGVILSNGLNLAMEHHEDRFDFYLMVFAGIIFYIYKHPLVVVLMMIVCGFLSLAYYSV